MMPRMGSVVAGWGSMVQMKVIRQRAADFEVADDVLAVETIYMQITVMKARDVDRKPEGERIWKWWSGITTSTVGKDTILQDPEGIEYRVADTRDWSQAGLFLCDLVEQPKGNI